MTPEPKIYLAGPIEAEEDGLKNAIEWRQLAMYQLQMYDAVALLPWTFRPGAEQPPRRFQDMPPDMLQRVALEAITYDMACVERADAVIAEVRPGVRSEGTSGEVTLARYLKKPVVIYAPVGIPALHRWCVHGFPICTSIETSVQEALFHVRARAKAVKGGTP